MPDECLFCSCWNSEFEGCEMPSIDKIYACPLFCDTDNDLEGS